MNCVGIEITSFEFDNLYLQWFDRLSFDYNTIKRLNVRNPGQIFFPETSEGVNTKIVRPFDLLDFNFTG